MGATHEEDEEEEEIEAGGPEEDWEEKLSILLVRFHSIILC